MPNDSLARLEARIDRLERENAALQKRARRVAALGGAAAIVPISLLLVGFAPAPPPSAPPTAVQPTLTKPANIPGGNTFKPNVPVPPTQQTIRTRHLEIVDERGRVTAALDGEGGKSFVSLWSYSSAQDGAMTIAIDSDGAMELYDARGTRQVEISSAGRVAVAGWNGRPGASLTGRELSIAATSDTGSRISLGNLGGDSELRIGTADAYGRVRATGIDMAVGAGIDRTTAGFQLERISGMNGARLAMDSQRGASAGISAINGTSSMFVSSTFTYPNQNPPGLTSTPPRRATLQADASASLALASGQETFTAKADSWNAFGTGFVSATRAYIHELSQLGLQGRRR